MNLESRLNYVYRWQKFLKDTQRLCHWIFKHLLEALDFPGSPVINALNTGWMGSIPGWRTKIPHVMWQNNNNKFQKGDTEPTPPRNLPSEGQGGVAMSKGRDPSGWYDIWSPLSSSSRGFQSFMVRQQAQGCVWPYRETLQTCPHRTVGDKCPHCYGGHQRGVPREESRFASQGSNSQIHSASVSRVSLLHHCDFFRGKWGPPPWGFPGGCHGDWLLCALFEGGLKARLSSVFQVPVPPGGRRRPGRGCYGCLRCAGLHPRPVHGGPHPLARPPGRPQADFPLSDDLADDVPPGSALYGVLFARSSFYKVKQPVPALVLSPPGFASTQMVERTWVLSLNPNSSTSQQCDLEWISQPLSAFVSFSEIKDVCVCVLGDNNTYLASFLG